MTTGFLVYTRQMREYTKFKNHLEKFNKDFIQEKLNVGLTVRHISLLVGIPEKRLGEMIKHFELTVTNSGTTHIVNHHYFDDIDTEEKAYFLGFLVADGCVTQAKRKSGFMSKRITFCNSISDKEVIEKFRDVVCPTVEIKWTNRSSDTITRKDQSSFKFTSEHMFDVLVEKYKILPKKTHDLNFCLPELGKYTRHFIRGFMDGDGHVRKNNLEFIATSVCFMNQIENFFQNKGFVTRNKKVEGKTVDYYRIYVNINKANIENIYSLLYADASVFLERKRIKFKNTLTFTCLY
jgi:hypothetical protein